MQPPSVDPQSERSCGSSLYPWHTSEEQIYPSSLGQLACENNSGSLTVWLPTASQSRFGSSDFILFFIFFVHHPSFEMLMQPMIDQCWLVDGGLSRASESEDDPFTGLALDLMRLIYPGSSGLLICALFAARDELLMFHSPISRDEAAMITDLPLWSAPRRWVSCSGPWGTLRTPSYTWSAPRRSAGSGSSSLCAPCTATRLTARPCAARRSSRAWRCLRPPSPPAPSGRRR